MTVTRDRAACFWAERHFVEGRVSDREVRAFRDPVRGYAGRLPGDLDVPHQAGHVLGARAQHVRGVAQEIDESISQMVGPDQVSRAPRAREDTGGEHFERDDEPVALLAGPLGLGRADFALESRLLPVLRNERRESARHAELVQLARREPEASALRHPGAESALGHLANVRERRASSAYDLQDRSRETAHRVTLVDRVLDHLLVHSVPFADTADGLDPLALLLFRRPPRLAVAVAYLNPVLRHRSRTPCSRQAATDPDRCIGGNIH